ncbi:MAG: homoserine dehydrogenase [Lachnospiraceae bacterium]|nr:homoserine dehydrogenase [Lachnospiraceae bacterium]
MAKIAILGYGTVGSGVAEVFWTNEKLIDERAGEEIRIKYVLDLRDFPGDRVEAVLTHDFSDIVNDPEVTVVAEVMGGMKPAYDFTKQCLMAGKSVCTSNKELVAAKGPELMRIAREHHVNYLYEASCGGGIPIIRAMNESLNADDLSEISGILNGTTNYILTEMTENGTDFGDALKRAQELGYAERNPEADVEGYDAQRKIAILSSIAYGKTVYYEDIHTEGISGVTPTDIEYAKKLKMKIRLLASSFREKGKYYAMVAPVLVEHTHPLYSVDGVFNAIFVKGNMLGDAMFYGSGAGKLPTASAVAADMIQAVKAGDTVLYSNWKEEEADLSPLDSSSRRFFVRVPVEKKEEAIRVFGMDAEQVNLEERPEETALITGIMTEQEFEQKAAKLGGILGRIRINM